MSYRENFDHLGNAHQYQDAWTLADKVILGLLIVSLLGVFNGWFQ